MKTNSIRSVVRSAHPGQRLDSRRSRRARGRGPPRRQSGQYRRRPNRARIKGLPTWRSQQIENTGSEAQTSASGATRTKATRHRDRQRPRRVHDQRTAARPCRTRRMAASSGQPWLLVEHGNGSGSAWRRPIRPAPAAVGTASLWSRSHGRPRHDERRSKYTGTLR